MTDNCRVPNQYPYTPFLNKRTVILFRDGLCVCAVTQSCLTLCDPMDCSPTGSSVHGILQVRILDWVAISFSRVSSQPRDWTQVSCIIGRFFTIWATYPPIPYILIAFLFFLFFLFGIKLLYNVVLSIAPISLPGVRNAVGSVVPFFNQSLNNTCLSRWWARDWCGPEPPCLVGARASVRAVITSFFFCLGSMFTYPHLAILLAIFVCQTYLTH